jgi:hypothetical protein
VFEQSPSLPAAVADSEALPLMGPASGRGFGWGDAAQLIGDRLTEAVDSYDQPGPPGT